MAARKPDVRSSLERTAEQLDQRFTDLEELARENRRILETQFKRMAAMQAQIDRLMSNKKP